MRIFPNNWVSFHACGTLVLYPLRAPSRRPERRQAVIDAAVRQLSFQVTHLLDLSWYEGQGKYLEGTGSLVLDHLQRVAYACASARTDPQLVSEWARALGYEPVIFSAAEPRGRAALPHQRRLMDRAAAWRWSAREAIAPADRERVLVTSRRQRPRGDHDPPGASSSASRATCSSSAPGTRRWGTRGCW